MRSSRAVLAVLAMAFVHSSAFANQKLANADPDADPSAGQQASIPAPVALNSDADDRLAASAFYRANGETAQWVASTGLSARGAALLGELRKAGEWGLDADALELRDIPESTSGTALPLEKLAALESRLTLAALKYARQARGGRIGDPAKQLSSYLDRTPQLIPPAIVLKGLASASDPAAYLRGLHPKHPQFEALRQRYLARLNSPGQASGDVAIIPAGPLLKPGTTHPHVGLLRQRLAVPAAEGGDANLFDEALTSAVKAFQKDKGQSADGVVGNATRNALNDVETVTPERLRANMEMLRWLPDEQGPLYVSVNIPEFKMRVVKDGRVIHEERVITGEIEKQTPIFSDTMELVTFHPKWHVPESIKVRELYPSLARGGTYVQKQGLKISLNGRQVDPESVDWSSADIRRYDVHQPPGAQNVLGVLKFSFPNKHLVYMHDTSSRNLFEAERRTFSHGCVRVRNPERLAEIVLEADKGWDAAKVASMLQASPVENPVKLDRGVPVHVSYQTIVINSDGREHAFKDVYGHEQKVIQALAGKWDLIARGPDHLAPVTYPKERYADGNVLETFVNNLFGGF